MESPALRLLLPHDESFKSAKSLFINGWQHANKLKPVVLAVYEVIKAPETMALYYLYREEVEQRATGTWSTPGNEQMLFHGTVRHCRVGETKPDKLPCQSSALNPCSICGIIRRSFDVDMSGMRRSFQRFGKGIYTSSVPSKTDDYNVNDDAHTFSRVLLINRVVVGNGYPLPVNAQSLSSAPHGFDSILGVTGGHLNYEGTVVYRNDAIRPAYLLVYADKKNTMNKRARYPRS